MADQTTEQQDTEYEDITTTPRQDYLIGEIILCAKALNDAAKNNYLDPRELQYALTMCFCDVHTQINAASMIAQAIVLDQPNAAGHPLEQSFETISSMGYHRAINMAALAFIALEHFASGVEFKSSDYQPPAILSENIADRMKNDPSVRIIGDPDKKSKQKRTKKE